MNIEHLFDPRTFTLTYVVWDPATKDAAIIDPVLDYDPLDVRVFTESLERLEAFVKTNGLKPHYVLETHAHADHLSGAQELKRRFGSKIAIGASITAVQETFAGLLDFEKDFPLDGSQFDTLLTDGGGLEVGSLRFEALHTPGHTPACMTYKVGDAVFTGDALFMPDSGTGRADFPKGSAEDLYDSITKKIYTLPDDTRVFVGHDYQPNGRNLECETTVGASKAKNIMLPGDLSRDAFIEKRTGRDRTLRPPNLIFQSIQVNIRAGELPPPAANGRRYLKLPLNLLGG